MQRVWGEQLKNPDHGDVVTFYQLQVMGYPSIKFFSPGTPAGDMGEERASRDKSVPAIKVLSDG